MISKDVLLQELPPFRDEWTLLHKDQRVGDIINEVLNAHLDFSEDYDRIKEFFAGGTVPDICNRLYDFCKRNLKYLEEPENEQTVASPGAMLSRGRCDCKGYSNFSAGVLSAMCRDGEKIDWCYRFASYDLLRKTPHHVFVVVRYDGSELWIDPTPGSENKLPVWQVDKKISNDMPLYKLSGFDNSAVGIIAEEYNFTEPVDSTVYSGPGTVDIVPIEQTFIASDDAESDDEVPQETKDAINLLLSYGVTDTDGNFFEERLLELYSILPVDEYQKLTEARYHLEEKVISGFFKNIFRGFKKVGMSIPRNAYLSLVALNAFGTATKIAQAIQTPAGKQKIGDVWYKLGGNPDKLWNAVTSGAKKKKLLGFSANTIGVAPVIPAWVAAATAIIAAMTPIINKLLQSQPPSTPYVSGYDPSLKYTSGTGSTDPLEWIKAHPLPVAAVGVGAVYFLTKKPKQVSGFGLPGALMLLIAGAGAYFYFKSKSGATGSDRTYVKNYFDQRLTAEGAGYMIPAYDSAIASATDAEVSGLKQFIDGYISRGLSLADASGQPWYNTVVGFYQRFNLSGS